MATTKLDRSREVALELFKTKELCFELYFLSFLGYSGTTAMLTETLTSSFDLRESPRQVSDCASEAGELLGLL